MEGQFETQLKIVSPWVDHYRKIEAMFKNDPDIRIEFDNDDRIVKLFIDGQDKYDALSQLLPEEKVFGAVTLKIQLIPDNKLSQKKIDLFRKAFNGNPVVVATPTVPRSATGSSNDFDYVVFKKEVVQYHNDTLADPHGTCSTLYQSIADDIFIGREGVYFCTDNQ